MASDIILYTSSWPLVFIVLLFQTKIGSAVQYNTPYHEFHEILLSVTVIFVPQVIYIQSPPHTIVLFWTVGLHKAIFMASYVHPFVIVLSVTVGFQELIIIQLYLE